MTKQLDENGNYSDLTVGELRQIIQDLPDSMEVKIRACVNLCGNIVAAGIADKSSYGFFGTEIPCLIIEPSYNDYIIDGKIRESRKPNN